MTPDQLLERPAGRPSVADRLAARVDVAGPDDCHEWSGSRLPRGYGQIRWGKRVVHTHRVAYVLANGPVPDGLDVLHRCDNPPCCNVRHLRAGTGGRNVQDRVDRGRSALGLQHGNGRLSDDDVRSIRRAHASGETPTVIAARYGIHRKYVGDLVARRARRHVSD